MTAVQGESERIDQLGLVQAQHFAGGGGRGENPEIADRKPAVIHTELARGGRGQARAKVAADRYRRDQLFAAGVAHPFRNGQGRRHRL